MVMAIGLFESTGILLAILVPLVAVPLTVITFYLRSLREQQVIWQASGVRRIELLEQAVGDLRKVLTEFERDYTGKEEWLRECMHTRRLTEQLIEATVRVETTVGLLVGGFSQGRMRGAGFMQSACGPKRAAHADEELDEVQQ